MRVLPPPLRLLPQADATAKRLPIAVPFLFGNIKFTLRACAKFTIKYSKLAKFYPTKNMQTWKPAFYACEVFDWDSSHQTPAYRSQTGLTHFYLARNHHACVVNMKGCHYMSDTSLSVTQLHIHKTTALLTELNTHVNHNKNIMT